MSRGKPYYLSVRHTSEHRKTKRYLIRWPKKEEGYFIEEIKE